MTTPSPDSSGAQQEQGGEKEIFLLATPYGDDWAAAIQFPELVNSITFPDRREGPQEARSDTEVPSTAAPVDGASSSIAESVEKPVEAVKLTPAPRPVNESYDVAVGTIVGRQHLGSGEVVLGINNQDSLLALLRDEYGLIIVCDGCSEAKHSEVGAKILSRLFAKSFQEHRNDGAMHEILAAVQADVIKGMGVFVDQMALDTDSREQIVRDYFLCTVLGVFVDQGRAFFWGMGDGVYGVDSRIRVIQPAPGNFPSYIGYHLFKEWPANIAQKDLEIYETVPYQPSAILVGSDGVKDLMDLAGHTIPGSDEKLGDIGRFWKEDRYWQNPDELARELRRLQMIHKSSDVTTREEKMPGTTRIITEVKDGIGGGLLPDDTTLAIMRLRPQETRKPELGFTSSWSRPRPPMSEEGKKTVGGMNELPRYDLPRERKPSYYGYEPRRVDPIFENKPVKSAEDDGPGFFKRLGSALWSPFAWVGRQVAALGRWIASPFRRAPKEAKPEGEETGAEEKTIEAVAPVTTDAVLPAIPDETPKAEEEKNEEKKG